MTTLPNAVCVTLCVTLSPSVNLEDPLDFLADQNIVFFQLNSYFFLQRPKTVTFPRQILPIPDKISRFPTNYPDSRQIIPIPDKNSRFPTKSPDSRNNFVSLSKQPLLELSLPVVIVTTSNYYSQFPLNYFVYV